MNRRPSRQLYWEICSLVKEWADEWMSLRKTSVYCGTILGDYTTAVFHCEFVFAAALSTHCHGG